MFKIIIWLDNRDKSRKFHIRTTLKVTKLSTGKQQNTAAVQALYGISTLELITYVSLPELCFSAVAHYYCLHKHTHEQKYTFSQGSFNLSQT